METNTWSEEDHLHGYCTQSQIGQPIDHSIWSLRDYQERACTAAQIGQSKNPAPDPKPLAPDPKPDAPSNKTYAQKLSELSEAAVDSVLNHPGGARQWFKDNPSAHVRVLTKLATPAAEAQARVVIEIPWIQQGRLSYRDSAPVKPVIEDVEPKAAAPWKEPAQDPAIGAGVSVLKHQLLNPKG